MVIDANSGVQAQTVAHFNHAILNEIPIIPVINKIDLKNADPDAVAEQLQKLFSIEPSDIVKISAKNGINIEGVIDALIKRLPPPPANRDAPFKALLFDSWFDKYMGVICLVSMLDGSLTVGEEIVALKTKQVYKVQQLGVISPDQQPVDVLMAGQAGFIILGMRDTVDAHVGDVFITKTQYEANKDKIHLSGVDIPDPRPMVYAGVFPGDECHTNELKSALQKILLTDPSVELRAETSAALGNGYRLGFLGLLHMEVFNQRLEQEFDALTVITAPSVPYRIKIKGEKNIKMHGSDTLTINNPLKLPEDLNIVEKYFEPMVKGTIIVSDQYLPSVTALVMERRGVHLNSTYIDNLRLIVQYKFPLAEIIVDFYDRLKSLTSGYASFDYEDAGYEESDVVRLDILLNDNLVEELTTMVHLSRAREIGGEMCKRLKETLPSQQFSIKIQAAIGKKIVGREDKKSMRKDVSQKLKSGGDKGRRDKLLARQKEGKERLRSIGNIQIPRDCFIQLLKK